MKYFLLASDYPPMKGGIATVLRDFPEVFATKDLKILAAGPRQPEDEANMVRLPAMRGSRGLAHLPAFLKWLGESLKSVPATGEKMIILGALSPLGVLGPLLKAMKGADYVMIAYGSEIPDEQTGPLRKKIAGTILEQSRAVLCISKYTENRVKKIAPRAKTYRIDLGVDSEYFRPRPKNPAVLKRFDLQNKIVLLAIGRLVPRKGFDTAISAFSAIAAHKKETVLLIAGDGPDKSRLMGMAESNPEIKGRVIFCGEIEDSERIDFYNAADIVLFLTREVRGDVEGFGLVALEAGACEKPVIAGDNGGVSEAVLAGETGVMVDSMDPDKLAEEMTLLIENPDLRERLGKNARRYAEQRNFSKFSASVLKALEL